MSAVPARRPILDAPLLPGYDAAALDKSVRRYVSIAERNLAVLEDLGAPLGEKVKAEVANLDAESASIIYDRLVKAGLNLVKATDELSRLRSFLSGGPDSRPDLSSMSEIELRAVVLAAVQSLGITDLKQLRDSSPAA